MRKLPFFVLSALVAVAATASAEPAAPAPAPAPRLAPGVVLEPVNVPPAVKQRFASKQRFDPSKLAVSVRGSIPVLKTQAGRSYQLLPSSADPPPRLARPATLPSELEPERAKIEAWRPGVRPALEFSDTATSHLATQTPIKDQGPRGTCVAFSNMAGMEAWMKRNKNRTLDLSENHAHELFVDVGNGVCTPDGGVGLQSMLTLKTHGVCAESLFPYTSSCPSSVPSGCANAAERLRITKLLGLSFPDDPMAGILSARNVALLEAIIAHGWDIEYSIKVAGSDWNDSTAQTGVIDVQVDGGGNPVGSVGNHGILLVGYNHAGGYFVFKNSWGADWGHGGYGHVSFDYLETYGRYGYAILGVGP